MFKLLIKEVVRRVARDARDIGQRFVSPETTTRVATNAARALTRNWAAANILAEGSAARWSASSPSPVASDAPLRVLFAARFGAMSPVAEAHALDALTALEVAATCDRVRPIELTLCGTSALSPAGAPTSELARRILRHRVLDATIISAADIAAWIGEHDVVLTCNDFGATSTAIADIELAAMALGFARARGLVAVGLGVASEVFAFSPPARDFLRRFAKKAVFGVHDATASSGLTDEGFAAFHVASGRPLSVASSEGLSAVVVAAAPYQDGGSTIASPLAEGFRLGALLFGGAPTPTPATASVSPSEVVAALRLAEIPVTAVCVGFASQDPDLDIDLKLADGASWRAYLDSLGEGTRILTDAPDIAADAHARGLAVISLSALSPGADGVAERVRAARPTAPPPGLTIAAFIAELLAPLSPLGQGPKLLPTAAEAKQ